MVEKAVILAAGSGTRDRPFTYYLPKTMLPYGEYPLLHHQIANLCGAGIKEIVIISRKDDESTTFAQGGGKGIFSVQNDYIEGTLKPEFAGKCTAIKVLYQKNDLKLGKPKGPGESVIAAEKEVEGLSYLVIFGDVLIEPIPGTDTNYLKDILSKFEGDVLVSTNRVGRDKVTDSRLVIGEYTGQGLVRIKDMVRNPPQELFDSYATEDGLYTATLEGGGIQILNKGSMSYLKAALREATDEIHVNDAIEGQCTDRAGRPVYGFDIDYGKYVYRDFGEVKKWLSHNLEPQNVNGFRKSLGLLPHDFAELAREKAKELLGREF